jgi:hypothetical protein
MRLEDQIEAVEEELERLKQDLQKVQLEDLPAMMEEVGLDSFALTGGFVVKTAPFIKCRMPKLHSDEEAEQIRAKEAYEWLEAGGHADIAKHTVSLPFTKGENKKVQEAIKVLKKAGFDPNDQVDVHWKTLQSFIKEQLAEGVNVPLDLFDAYVGPRTKISRPKESK